ncbi:MAG: AAA-like domain-containing protein [Bacteroidota bacterium]
MKKRFNITGTCFPEQHYLMDNSQKLAAIFELIESGAYFTINRPRQYGKTTSMIWLAKKLSKTEIYLPIELSFQGLDAQWYESDKKFAEMFIRQIIKSLKYTHSTLTNFLSESIAKISDLQELSELITEFIHKINRKVVLFIDEVDASSNYEPFLKLLSMLRTKYLQRDRPSDATFHSIVLAGVHDIKSLKFKLRNPEDADYNSPWNIAVDFEVRMSFNPKEIAPMLVEYGEAEGVAMDVPTVAERLYYHTSGYPFLVSKLCLNIQNKVLPKKTERTWTVEDVDAAVRILLDENNTNFDSLFKNLANHPDMYDLVQRILIEGESIPFNSHNPVIHKAIIYGIFKRNGQIKIHNRIYEQLIYNYMASVKLTSMRNRDSSPIQFQTENNGLDFKAVLLKFQQFMKENHSEKSLDFLEREGRIIFLAFLSPILNGQGYAFREVQTSMEKRLDIIVTHFQHRYIIELKKWYGKEYHKKGLKQLADYLDIHGVNDGFLVIFDSRKEKEYQSQEAEVEGKRVFMVWV